MTADRARTYRPAGPIGAWLFGAALGVVGFTVLGLGEISERLNQGGAGSLVGLGTDADPAGSGQLPVQLVVLVVSIALVRRSGAVPSRRARI